MTSLAIDYINFSGIFKYSACNLGTSLDFITQILFGTRCS